MNTRSIRPPLVVLLVGLSAAALFAFGTISATARQADSDAPREHLSTFMQVKLKLAQKVLEGLAVEDYPLIAKSSRDIGLLCQAESWQVLQTPEYNQQSLEFRRAVDKITVAAREKDLDAATLAYVDVTMKCINCHKYLRGVKFAGTDLDTLLPAETLAGK